MCLAVFNLGFTGIHCPLVISPGCNNLDIRSEGFNTQLKTNLVVTLSGSAVADSGSTFFSCNFNQLLCNQRSCHGSTEQILVLIDSVCLNTGNDVVVTELVNDIFNVELGSTAGLCSFFQTVQLFCLSTVYTDTDNFIIKVLL